MASVGRHDWWLQWGTARGADNKNIPVLAGETERRECSALQCSMQRLDIWITAGVIHTGCILQNISDSLHSHLYQSEVLSKRGKIHKRFNWKFDFINSEECIFKIYLINIQYPNIKNFHLVEEGSEKRSLTAHTEETETSNKIGESRTRSLPSSSPSNNQRDTALYSFTQTVPANIW